MTEQSSADPATSAGATCRALVMLLCLVALPLMAFRGTTWSDLAKTVPEIAKKVLNNRWTSSPALAKESQPEVGGSEFGNAPALRAVQGTPEGRSAVADDASPRPGRDAATAGAIGPRRLASPFADVVDHAPARTSDQPAPLATVAFQGGTLGQPPADAGPQWPQRLAPRGLKDDRGETPGRRVSWQQPEPETPRLSEGLRSRDADPADTCRTPLVPVARRDRAWAQGSQPEAPPLQNAVIRPDPQPLQSADPTDRFLYTLDRLRELGAVYYLLETWGNEGQRFRFHCKMAIGGNLSYTRHFEAIDRDALQAMARVLAEVEAWRAGR